MPDETTDRTGDEPDLVVDDAIGPDLDEEWTPPRDRSREAALVAAALSVLAAVLCVVAPFRAVYTLNRVVAKQRVSVSVDGWGRYSIPLSQHGPRYGLVLTVGILLLVLSAATQVARLQRPRMLGGPPDEEQGSDGDLEQPSDGEPGAALPLGGAAIGLAAAGAALLTGALGIIYLDVDTTVSNTSGDTSVDRGSMLWFLLAAWVVSVLALCAPWFEARRRT